MFVGYPINCKSDSMWIWDPTTNGVVVTYDVLWIQRMHFERLGTIGIIEYDLTAGDW